MLWFCSYAWNTHIHEYSVLGNFSIWSLQMEMALDELMFGADAEKEIKKPETAVP